MYRRIYYQYHAGPSITNRALSESWRVQEPADFVDDILLRYQKGGHRYRNHRADLFLIWTNIVRRGDDSDKWSDEIPVSNRDLIELPDDLHIFGIDSYFYDFHMRPIEEQTILIAGATSGLGLELARALAKLI